MQHNWEKGNEYWRQHLTGKAQLQAKRKWNFAETQIYKLPANMEYEKELHKKPNIAPFCRNDRFNWLVGELKLFRWDRLKGAQQV